MAGGSGGRRRRFTRPPRPQPVLLRFAIGATIRKKLHSIRWGGHSPVDGNHLKTSEARAEDMSAAGTGIAP